MVYNVIMLPITQRITRSQWDDFYQAGKIAARGEFLSIRVGTSASPRAAIVVPKKHARLSVLRHTIKRALYQSIAPYLNNDHPNIYMIFIHKKGMVDDYVSELNRLLRT